MSNQSPKHTCPSYPCPICAATFPHNSVFAQPYQMNIYDVLDTPQQEQPKKTAKVDQRDLDDLDNALRELEALTRRSAPELLRHVYDARESFDRVRDATLHSF